MAIQQLMHAIQMLLHSLKWHWKHWFVTAGSFIMAVVSQRKADKKIICPMMDASQPPISATADAVHRAACRGKHCPPQPFLTQSRQGHTEAD